MNEETEFKKIAKETLDNIYSRLNGEEKQFLSYLVNCFNISCEKREQLQNNWNELKKLIDERIGDCRYFLTNADINYEKENMKKFMWLKEELQVLKSKAQELEQGKDE